MNDDPSNLDGTDGIGIIDWFRDLTYNEVHLFILGAWVGLSAPRPFKHGDRLEPPESRKQRFLWEHNEWYWQSGVMVGHVVGKPVAAWVTVTFGPQLAGLIA